MAQAVIQIYQLALNNVNPNAIFWVRSGDLPTIAGAVSALGDALQTAVDAGEAMPIQQAALNSQFVDTTQCGRGDLHLGPPDELLGAGPFASNLLRAFAPGDAFGVHSAASDLLSALDVVSSTHRVGYPYIDPTELWKDTDTLTILAPLLRDTPPPLTWRASIYRDAAPFNAIWVPDPTQAVIVSQTFAFVRDSRWDEFLEHWYTGPMTPTVGEWCNYVPLALVVDDTTPTLALSVASDGETVQLTWTPPAGSEPALYHVLACKPGGINQVLVAVVEPDQTTYSQDGLKPGNYEIVVAAVDVSGDALAVSQPVKWQVMVRLCLLVNR